MPKINEKFFKFFSKIFASLKIIPYFCTRLGKEKFFVVKRKLLMKKFFRKFLRKNLVV
jgi:hypothetical protein